MCSPLAPLALLAACLASQDPRDGAEPLPPGFPRAVLDLHDVGGRAGALHPLFRQVAFAPDGSRELRIVREERPTTEAPWLRRERSWPLGFAVTDLATYAGGDRVVLAGMDDDGATVVERWSFPRSDGDWIVPTPIPPPDLGRPQPPFELRLAVRGGGPYVPPDPDEPLPEPVVERLHEGEPGPLTALGADPEGRFLLMWSWGDHALYRLLLPAPGGPPERPERLLTPDEHPALVQLASLEPGRHAGERIWLGRRNLPAEPPSDERFTVFRDADDDGGFESVTTHEPEGWRWEEWELFRGRLAGP